MGLVQIGAGFVREAGKRKVIGIYFDVFGFGYSRIDWRPTCGKFVDLGTIDATTIFDLA